MAEYTDDLALIVRYDGTKEAFEAVKSSYLGKVVFIYGSKTEVENQAGLVQAIWVSDASGGRYLDMANVDTIKEGMTHIAGLAIEGTVKALNNGANGINFKGANGISITFNPSNSTDQNGVPYWNVEVNGQGVIDTITGKSGDSVNTLTLYGVKNYALATANTAKSDIIGKDTDTESSDTIKGAKKYADKVKTDLEGATSDNKDSATIAGAKKYADNVKSELLGDANDSLDDKTIRGNANAIKVIGDAFPVTLTNNNDGTYTIKQGLTVVGTITIPKDMVVSKGSVVKGTWSGDTFTESTSGTGTAIKLEIANGDTLYINAATLVDVYTAQQNATEIQLEVSAANVISATIVSGAVSEAKIAANAVTTAKIKDGNVTKAKLETAVQSSLDKADNAISTIGIYIPTDDANYLSGNVGTSGTIRTISLDVKTETIGNATSDTTKGGLATAEDVAAYLKKRLSVKVVS